MATEEELKRAYKAFKKRIKLARLDDASGLSRGTKTSKIGGITPALRLPAQHLGGARRAGQAQTRRGRGLFARRRALTAATPPEPAAPEPDTDARASASSARSFAQRPWRWSDSPGPSGSTSPTSRPFRSSAGSRITRGRWSWLGLAMIVGGLALGTTRRCGRLGLVLTLPVLIWLVLGDQLRFQPWVYQFLILGALLAALPPRAALAFSRVWMASTFLHSGLSKADVSFAHEMGPLFVKTLARVVGLGGHPFLASPARLEAAAMLMPAGEIVVALLLLIPRTQRLGYLGAVLMHAALLLILGPWGLGHSTIVLVWNAVLLTVEESILFWPRRSPGAGPFPWGLREKLVAVPFGLPLLLPF